VAQSNSGIGNVIPNTELVQLAVSYARSRMLGAAARLRVANALGDHHCACHFRFCYSGPQSCRRHFGQAQLEGR
jgi:hypothetical protein